MGPLSLSLSTTNNYNPLSFPVEYPLDLLRFPLLGPVSSCPPLPWRNSNSKTTQAQFNSRLGVERIDQLFAMDDAFSKSTPEVLKHFGVSEAKGLSEQQVKAQRQKYGPNGMLEAVNE